jgi:hypothetical protein
MFSDEEKRIKTKKKIDWHLKRLGKLANLVKKIFPPEKKSVLSKEVLIKRRIMMHILVTILGMILIDLINSNGWLKTRSGCINKN